MSVHTVQAPVFFLTCDVSGCREATDPSAVSRGCALNGATLDGWRTYGHERHVCPTRDHAHEEAARRFFGALQAETKP